MKWKRNTGFDQIEDRRGQGGGGGGFGGLGGGGGIPIPIPGGKAGGGIGGLIIVVVIFLLTSGILGGGGMGALSDLGTTGGGQPGGTLNPQSDTDQFLSYVVADIQDFWAATFSESGRDYPETVLVLFEGGTTSSCGPASSATGPFYCPADQKVYLDLGFFDELESRFGAQDEDIRSRVGHMAGMEPDDVHLTFGGFPDLEATLRENVRILQEHPYLKRVPVHGLIFEVGTGRLHQIV